MFQLWKLTGPEAFSVASSGAETFVTPVNLTELHFPYLQYEINQVYMAELLCRLRKLCSGLQQTLINAIILFFFFSFRLSHATHEILFSRLGVEPLLPALEAQTHNHQTAREVSMLLLLHNYFPFV